MKNRDADLRAWAAKTHAEYRERNYPTPRPRRIVVSPFVYRASGMAERPDFRQASPS